MKAKKERKREGFEYKTSRNVSSQQQQYLNGRLPDGGLLVHNAALEHGQKVGFVGLSCRGGARAELEQALDVGPERGVVIDHLQHGPEVLERLGPHRGDLVRRALDKYVQQGQHADVALRRGDALPAFHLDFVEVGTLPLLPLAQLLLQEDLRELYGERSIADFGVSRIPDCTSK